MPEFLNLMPPGQARRTWFDRLPPLVPEKIQIETTQALGRVTALPVAAATPLPAFPRSTVDGYAVRARDTFGASDSLPAYLTLAGEIRMGAPVNFNLQSAQAVLIHTGGMLPEGSDAVVMLEQTQIARPNELEVLKSVAPGENILRPGEDVAQGELVIPTGRRLRPAEIGGLMALGIRQVWVSQPPRVGILSSGDELVDPQVEPAPGQVRDVNSYSLAALVQQTGGTASRYGIVPDDAEALRLALRRALDENDCVVITAGSSASARDLTARVIQESGSPGVLVHGVNVRPGKPTILAVCDGKAVVGLPGNPVSALVIAGLFVVPLLRRLLGMPDESPSGQISASLTVNIASQAGREDWVPVVLRPASQGYLADPIFYKSNLIFSLVKADGLAHIPAEATGLSTGEQVIVELI
ncbi:MAG: molybdopterin-binding protein [Chloroflexi bacterium]|nr:molybdopterin-binding protein [Chloroflexota bacterium]